MSAASTGWPNSQRLARGRRQQAGQHLHRRGLAAAVRAEEAEDLAALDREADAVDGGEVAEAAGQVARRRWPARRRRGARGGMSQRPVAGARRLRQQGDEAVLQRRRAGARLRCPPACRWPAPGRHSSPPASRSARPPPCRRSRRSRSCPAGAARMRSIRSQNWRRDSGSTPVVGSSRISRSGSWISAQHRPSFCRMPPESLLRRPVGERARGRCSRSRSAMRRCRSRAALAEQAAEEVDVLARR